MRRARRVPTFILFCSSFFISTKVIPSYVFAQQITTSENQFDLPADFLVEFSPARRTGAFFRLSEIRRFLNFSKPTAARKSRTLFGRGDLCAAQT